MTAHHRTRRGRPHFHCLGIGVGPANLSLASLMHPHSSRISHLFLDRKPSFGWHDGQQIPGAVLQVSPLKDLVTLADPTNPFSFLAYLHEQGRIYHYINAQFDAVPRQEFRNYLEWASHRNSNIVFGEEVLSVTFDGASGGAFVVHTGSRTLSADNLAIGVGSTPWVPPFAEPQLGTSQFHVSRFRELAGDLTARRVVVVGGGQSGAEAFLDLISRPEAELPRQVSWVSRRRNFLPIDDSPFTNDFFMPCHSEYFFGLDRPTRTAFNSRHVLASDGITESTLRSIYQQVYVHRFTGEAKDLTSFHPNREVTAVTGSDAEGWRIRLAHNDAAGAAEWLEADVVVWATGLRPGPMDFLDPIAGRLERDGDEYRIDRDFAVRWDGPPDRSLFLQNAARGQRGLADPNLSLSAWRSMRILDRLRGTHTPDQLPSFISWGPESPAGTPGEDR
ncbi:lysine N(6)-hydroxylase/L-ornithine N(5)-oxygenase family protein [Streptacidiphilus griseoplanus]|uniref:lysine N(6)-hydroxylase/L-ornithine N(5)-oxygenase family protein n=1 Tax=Peterkaempfera griseoplana TaxID=66896 RepID=UPI0006E45011|nr:SidA/IucD/PvdA family monooxygenase [Peterkaempfera griseoplana]